MKTNVMYQIDADDPPELAADRLADILYLMGEHVLDEDKAEKQRRAHPGLKAITSIKGGNPFTQADINAVGDYVALLLSRHQSALERLVDERDQMPRDENSLKAYDFVIESHRQKVTAVNKLHSEFVDAFTAARSQDIAPAL